MSSPLDCHNMMKQSVIVLYFQILLFPRELKKNLKVPILFWDDVKLDLRVTVNPT